jgi:leader peptidase (prepilin peptidase) / N-methyltransferase
MEARMYWLELVVVFLFGICWGSFLALMVYRIPKELSIVKPRSFCDSCKTSLPFFYNIPLLSYLLLGGKCKYCSARIPARYPFIELLTGILFVLSYHSVFDDYYSLIRSILLITAIVPSIFIDLDHRIIPDRFSIGLVIVGFVLALFDPMMTWINSLLGILMGGGLLLFVAWTYYKLTGREGLGGGDIKLLAGLGALLGWHMVIMIMFFSSIMGALYGVFMMIFMRKGRLTEIPFGPFIGISAILYYFIQEGGFFR